MYKASIAQVREIINQVPLPDFVHHIEYELDEDHLGDPCVRIRLIVADEGIPKFPLDRDKMLKELEFYYCESLVKVPSINNHLWVKGQG